MSLSCATNPPDCGKPERLEFSPPEPPVVRGSERPKCAGRAAAPRASYSFEQLIDLNWKPKKIGRAMQRSVIAARMLWLWAVERLQRELEANR